MRQESQNFHYFPKKLMKIHFITNLLSLLIDIFIWIFIMKLIEEDFKEIMILSLINQSVCLILLISNYYLFKSIQTSYPTIKLLNVIYLINSAHSIIFISLENINIFIQISKNEKKDKNFTNFIFSLFFSSIKAGLQIFHFICFPIEYYKIKKVVEKIIFYNLRGFFTYQNNMSSEETVNSDNKENILSIPNFKKEDTVILIYIGKTLETRNRESANVITNRNIEESKKENSIENKNKEKIKINIKENIKSNNEKILKESKKDDKNKYIEKEKDQIYSKTKYQNNILISSSSFSESSNRKMI